MKIIFWMIVFILLIIITLLLTGVLKEAGLAAIDKIVSLLKR